MPMTVTVLRSWDMACSLSGCLWPAYRWLGREHGRTIPLPDIQRCPLSNEKREAAGDLFKVLTEHSRIYILMLCELSLPRAITFPRRWRLPLSTVRLPPRWHPSANASRHPPARSIIGLHRVTCS